MLSIIHASPARQGQLNAKIAFYSIIHGPDEIQEEGLIGIHIET